MEIFSYIGHARNLLMLMICAQYKVSTYGKRFSTDYNHLNKNADY